MNKIHVVHLDLVKCQLMYSISFLVERDESYQIKKYKGLHYLVVKPVRRLIITASGKGLVPNRHQVITWTSDDLCITREMWTFTKPRNQLYLDLIAGQHFPTSIPFYVVTCLNGSLTLTVLTSSYGAYKMTNQTLHLHTWWHKRFQEL